MMRKQTAASESMRRVPGDEPGAALYSPSSSHCQLAHDRIQSQTEEYLKRGGQITRIPPGASGVMKGNGTYNDEYAGALLTTGVGSREAGVQRREEWQDAGKPTASMAQRRASRHGVKIGRG